MIGERYVWSDWWMIFDQCQDEVGHPEKEEEAAMATWRRVSAHLAWKSSHCAKNKARSHQWQILCKPLPYTLQMQMLPGVLHAGMVLVEWDHVLNQRCPGCVGCESTYLKQYWTFSSQGPSKAVVSERHSSVAAVSHSLFDVILLHDVPDSTSL